MAEVKLQIFFKYVIALALRIMDLKILFQQDNYNQSANQNANFGVLIRVYRPNNQGANVDSGLMTLILVLNLFLKSILSTHTRNFFTFYLFLKSRKVMVSDCIFKAACPKCTSTRLKIFRVNNVQNWQTSCEVTVLEITCIFLCVEILHLLL